MERAILRTHTFFCFSIAQKSIEQFEDMGFVLVVEGLDILQPFWCFGIDLHTGLADQIIQRDLKSIRDRSLPIG
jgi:hypothetical protein